MKFKISILIMISFLACKNENKEEVKTYNQLEKANWFIGKWGNTTKEGDLTEIWKKQNDSTFNGHSFFIAGKDTLFSEEIILTQKNDSLFYLPTVKNQNQGKTVAFYLTESSKDHLVFENPKHDFPSKITYTQVTKDSIIAEIFGIQNRKVAKESFSMKRK